MEFYSLAVDELDDDRGLIWPAEYRRRARDQCEHYLSEGVAPRTLVGFEAGHARGIVVYPEPRSPVLSCAWPVTDSEEVLRKLARGLLHAIRVVRPAAIVTLLENPSPPHHTRCQSLNGFRRLTTIHEYQRDRSPLDTVSRDVRNPGNVRLVPLDDPAIIRVLERTMLGSLDCPELGPFQSWDDRLAGFRRLSTDRFLVEITLLETENHPRGIAISTTDLGRGDCQLNYLGILPESRGQGWGRQLLNHLLNRPTESVVSRFRLIVDSRNIYARKIYESSGFFPTGEYPLWISDWDMLL